MKQFTRTLMGFLCVVTLFSACKEEEPLACELYHWSYGGPTGTNTWLTCFSDCAGSDQSPVDIVGAVANGNLAGLETNYKVSSTNLINNGHSIQQNYDQGSTFNHNGEVYDLLQVHFHTGSEHTVDGNRFPMEAHLVHKGRTSGNLAVIGILFERGTSNDFLAHFIDELPEEEEQQYFSSDTLNIASLLPSSGGYYTYDGSLTTPPCSEVVTWFVMKSTVEASSAQIDKFHDIMGDNYRPTQPLNGRQISSFN